MLMNKHTKFLISEETILHYLDGSLSEEAMHTFEEEMETSSFLKDAVEGLENFSDKQALRAAVKQLHEQLRQRTQKKRKQRWILFQQHQLQNIIIAIAILLLIIVGIIVVHYSRQKGL
jgi:anti-sigma factor RsiW